LIDQLEFKTTKRMPDTPSWFDWAVSQTYPSIRRQVQAPQGQNLTLIIEADPSDEIREAWEETWFLMLLIILMALIMFVTVNLLFNKAINSVTVIVKGLKAIEDGEYQHRIPDSKVTEFGTIARAVNHLTEALALAKKENRILTQRSLRIQEHERQRLAKELHDEMGQSVTAIKTLATTGKQHRVNHQHINESIIDICNHLFQVVRTMMRNLHPIVLSELGLKASLRDLIEHWEEKQPSINYQISCSDAADELDANTAIQVFRVVQECLTNIARHANAQRVIISLIQAQSREKFIITVEDDGQGCELILMKSGFGIMAIRERIENLNGKVSFDSSPDGGMRIVFEIPVSLASYESSK
jgi:two-component system sensor histidine kinase UhpB